MRNQFRIIVLLFAALTASTVSAQQFVSYDNPDMLRHEISAHFARPGWGSMPFDVTYGIGTTSSDWAYGFGLSYTYWHTEHYGLTSGLYLTYVSFHETFENVTSHTHGTICLTSSNGTSTQVHANMTILTPTIEESQALLMFELPVMFTAQARHLFGSLGFAFATTLSTYGTYYYDASDYRVASIDEMGVIFRRPVRADILETSEGNYRPSDIKHPFFFEIAADLGWKFYFDNRNMVSLALYGRYSLNKCTVSNDYYKVIDVSNSTSTPRSPLEAGLVSSFRYYNAGLSVTYHFGVGKPIKPSADHAARQ